ncbi:unnamed protein product [Owenia fusiformis]|uniref:NAD-dependent protein deacylase n=1 Tax=Owenia fusiformis TaxID=6347 RepID=A0A8S4Q641_OWEFU|nr:unnamed protein product [Owenia fusiformis]
MAGCTKAIYNYNISKMRTITISSKAQNFITTNLISILQKQHHSTQFVPEFQPIQTEDVQKLQYFVSDAKQMFVMTGAGISTESGIPDYRSEGVGLYARSTNRPVQYQDYVKSSTIRQRYWARNYVAWPRWSSTQPNQTHKTLADWENEGKIHWLVTQNVDSLHFKAGSKNLTELHGSTYRIMCLGCDNMFPRTQLQDMIAAENPNWSAASAEHAPDGDVALSPEQVAGFKVPNCNKCGGTLKPDITFFGDNVARDKVSFVFNKLEECDSVLVLGSSLQVYSGYRFLMRAAEQRKPIGIVNIGSTRADHLANVMVKAKCSDVLARIDCTDSIHWT